MTACMSLECVCNSSLLGKQTGGTGKLREPRETGQMKETIMAGQLKISVSSLCIRHGFRIPLFLACSGVFASSSDHINVIFL